MFAGNHKIEFNVESNYDPDQRITYFRIRPWKLTQNDRCVKFKNEMNMFMDFSVKDDEVIWDKCVITLRFSEAAKKLEKAVLMKIRLEGKSNYVIWHNSTKASPFTPS